MPQETQIQTEETQIQTTPKYSLPGFNVLLMGSSGSGKTTSLRSLVADCGLELFCIFTEPSMEILASSYPQCPWPEIDPDKVHWAYVPPSTTSFEDMLKSAKTNANLSWSAMSGQTSDPNKPKHAQSMVKLYQTLYNFVDQNGKEFGSVDSWDQSRVLVLDSLSGLNHHAMKFITGGALAKSQPQWGAAMATELDLLNKLCYDTKCHFVMTAHIEKELDQINGGQLITAHALGRANAPEIPKNFSDVILQRRTGKGFEWSTAAPAVDVAARNLPLEDKLSPGFKTLYNNWLAKATKPSQQAKGQEANKQEASVAS